MVPKSKFDPSYLQKTFDRLETRYKNIVENKINELSPHKCKSEAKLFVVTDENKFSDKLQSFLCDIKLKE